MKVQVYVYDLTRGMASALSPMFLGTRIEGVWHTGVVLDGHEEIFFGYGISRVRAGTTMFGQPHHIIDVGTTEVPKEMVDDLISDLRPRYMPEQYNLLFHNCNTFSNELCQLLTGEGLPEYILNQAEVIFNTPFGESITPFVLQMEGITGRVAGTGFAPAATPAAAPPANTPQPTAPSPWPASPAAAAGRGEGSTQGAAAAALITSAAANAGMAATAQAAQAASVANSSTAAEESEVAAAGAAAASYVAQATDAVCSSSGAISSSSGAVGSSSGQGGSSSSGAVGKVIAGVELLHITADSRTTEAAL